MSRARVERPAVALPRWVLLPAALGLLLFSTPLVAVLVRVPWPRVGPLLTSAASLDALRLSLLTAGASTLCCLLLGGPLALVLARSRGRGLPLLRAVVLLPLVLPPVVGGLALLFTVGRQGLLGPVLEALGVRVAFTTVAVVLAQTFVSMPFLVLSLEGALRSAAQGYEEVAATLGAGPGRVLLRITLPLVAPGLLAGAVLAFARSLGEFGATLILAGSVQGRTRTLPLEIYLQREVDPDAAVTLSLLLVAVSLVVVVALRGRLAGGVR
ncbi:ABC transporter permease [Kineococcus gynurae]|uniref:Molybdenum transport system permease n=1 Tax=Kineococcus gynurae TaxID=452979 RepID=A0ABV5LS69_9ACTN